MRTYRTDFEAVADGVATRSAFVPVLLTALALSIWLAFQMVQFGREQHQLDLATTSLLPQEQASTQLRAFLDEVAAATGKLAAQGNASARVIVEQLRSRGVTINSSKATTPPESV